MSAEMFDLRVDPAPLQGAGDSSVTLSTLVARRASGAGIRDHWAWHADALEQSSAARPGELRRFLGGATVAREEPS
jgi:hypothetical protein